MFIKLTWLLVVLMLVVFSAGLMLILIRKTSCWKAMYIVHIAHKVRPRSINCVQKTVVVLVKRVSLLDFFESINSKKLSPFMSADLHLKVE